MVKRSHQSFYAASSHRNRRPFADASADLDESMYVNQSVASEDLSSRDAFEGRTRLSRSKKNEGHGSVCRSFPYASVGDADAAGTTS